MGILLTFYGKRGRVDELPRHAKAKVISHSVFSSKRLTIGI